MRLGSSPLSVRYAPTAGVVVWESGARWRAFWRGELSPALPLRSIQQGDEVWEQLYQFRHGVLAIELSTKHAPQMIALLARVQAELPGVVCVVHLADDTADWELLVREAGAKFIINSPWQLAAQIAHIVRHLASAPQGAVGLREEIWQRLPWRASARSSHTEDPSA